MFDILFEKAKGQGRTVIRANVYAEAAVRRVVQTRFYEKFRRIHEKTSVTENLFGVFL